MSGIGPKADVAAAMARWPAEPYLFIMTNDDLQSVAHRIVERMVHEYPAEAAVVAALVLSEILSVGLHGRDEPHEAVAEFVLAVNGKLRDRLAPWRRSNVEAGAPCDPPIRQ